MTGQKNIRLVLEYDGSLYHGWQIQKNGITIQEVVEGCIREIIREKVKLIACGRTDAGVHALNQVCNFLTASDLDPLSIKKGLNSMLPDDIAVKQAEYCPIDFHARYHAKSKSYEYRILNRPGPDIFRRFYVWHIRSPLNAREMRRCCTALLGRHDFSSFQSSGSGILDPVREMIRAELHEETRGMLRFVFEANGFLRHMVRNIVGTLVDVGKGKTDYRGFVEILEAKDRRKAGIKAPSTGLFLTEVKY